MRDNIPWQVKFAMAQIDVKGWESVPSWLQIAVQMVRNGQGCPSCGPTK